MPSKITWRGDAPAISQVGTLTPGGQPLPGDVFGVPINGKLVTYTEGSAASIADVCAGLQTALAASTIAEFLEIVWTNPGGTAVIGTAATAGVPFTITSPTVTPASLTAPVLGAALVSGGSLTTATPYYYVATSTNSNGETTKSAQVTATPSGGNLSIALTWTAIPGSAGTKIYRSTTSNTYGSSSLLTTIGSGSTVTYTDTGGSLSSGQPPGSNTATSTATLTLSTVAGQGPNDVSVAANYSTGALPVNGDTLYLTATSSSLLYNLSALSAVTLAALYSDSTFTGGVGLPIFNSSGSFGATTGTAGSSGYFEYRPTYFQISGTLWYHGQGTGSGSNMFQLDLGSAQTTAVVYSTGNPLTGGSQSLKIKGSDASNAIQILKGSVGIGVELSDTTTTFATVQTAYVSNVGTDVALTIGVNVTLTTLTQNGGTVTYGSALTTHTLEAGTTAIINGPATVNIATLNNQGGTVIYNAAGTITTYKDDSNGTLDLSQNQNTPTITNAAILGELNDPNRCATHTNKPTFPNGILPTPGGATLNWGTNLALAHA